MTGASGVEVRGPGWDASLAPVRAVPVAEIIAALAGAPRLVVLDDDPTGTQTVRDIPVLTSWGVDDIRWALQQDTAGFFILTNTRSLPGSAAAGRIREIAEICLDAARLENVAITFASRGDSTLRGHYPLETDVLTAVLAEQGVEVDGVVLSPAYLDAGRVTLNGIHWTTDGQALTPVGEGEFARDATFGYRSSRLSEWVEEKSGGRIPRSSVVELGLEAIRTDGSATDAAVDSLDNGTVLVVDAVVDDDLRAVALSSIAAEGRGRTLLYRVGPSFVRARLGQAATAPLSDRDLDELTTASEGGLVVVGSHVGLTGRQLARLLVTTPATHVEIDVATVVDTDRRDDHLDDIVAAASAALRDGHVVVSTSRTLVTGSDEASSLEIARTVSSALTEAVGRIVAARRPRFVVAKGGITSSDVATDALRISRAWVRGSLLPGIVSLWQAASGPSAGLPYIVFAGNVGDDGSLARVVERLQQS